MTLKKSTFLKNICLQHNRRFSEKIAVVDIETYQHETGDLTQSAPAVSSIITCKRVGKLSIIDMVL